MIARSVPAAALSREQSAVYIGVSVGTFDKLVLLKEMPPARCYQSCSRKVWLRRELDLALEALPSESEDSLSYAGVEL